MKMHSSGKRKSVAVVGAGIYGITIAAHLAEKYEVHLFEKNPDILTAASWINQFRLHRGYHYPRSNSTIVSTLHSEPQFRRNFAPAIRKKVRTYYCIAKSGSKTNKTEYLSKLSEHGLKYTERYPDIIDRSSIDLCIQADETLINPHILYNLCWKKIQNCGIVLHLQSKFLPSMIDGYYHTVVATYASINSLLPKNKRQPYQHEVCEKPLVLLPARFSGQGIVIMDGPYTCVDTYGETGFHLIGNVVHAIHHTNVGEFPEIPAKIKPYLNKRLIESPDTTNFRLFIESARKFVPEITKARHIGSLYTVRTVLPEKDATDERPMIVRRIEENLTTVFSGKISNCVEAAEQIRTILED